MCRRALNFEHGIFFSVGAINIGTDVNYLYSYEFVINYHKAKN